MIKTPPSMHDALSQEPAILNFEGFVIRPLDGHNLWMTAPSGEGTQVRKSEFLGLLMKFFNENM
jgi:hypothetical protein